MFDEEVLPFTDHIIRVRIVIEEFSDVLKRFHYLVFRLFYWY